MLPQGFRSLVRLAALFVVLGLLAPAEASSAEGQRSGRLAYIVSDLRIPFWDIMWRGIRSQALRHGYEVTVHSADNSAKQELSNVVGAIKDRVDGIILSPTNSSAAVTILRLAEEASIPVVISDIGTDGGTYVSFISSDNRDGAYRIGRILAQIMAARGWQSGRVGIVAIPQKRANGQARTAGFIQAMDEAGIKGAGIRQQVDFSHQETYRHTSDLLAAAPDIRAIWLQGSDRYQAALDAIADAGRKGQVLLLTFDAEPEFIDLIPKGILAGAGMQQPFLMGEMSVNAMHKYLQGKPVEHNQTVGVLAVSAESISGQMAKIRRNVLGLGD